jgi:Tfp pilus assembly protein PilX
VTSTVRRQRGSTLIIALIMLVLLTLFAITSLKTSKTNLLIVGNMQVKNEALNASQEAIEKVLSTPQFITDPANAVINPCAGPNTLCTDLTGDGAAEFTSTLTPQPTCVAVKPIKNTDLVLTNSEDLGCSAGQQQNFGVAGAVTGDSLCSNSIWEITAQTVGTTAASRVVLKQGVGVRVSADAAGTACD